MSKESSSENLQKKVTEKTVIITYIEMVLDGAWQVVDMGSLRMDGSWHVYEISKEGGLVKLVRPDGLRRSWSFKPFTKLSVGHNAIKFDEQDVVDEIAIDEDEQRGNPPKSKVF